jgi:hypothetical protein
VAKRKTITLQDLAIQVVACAAAPPSNKVKRLSPSWWKRNDIAWLDLITKVWFSQKGNRDPRWRGDFRAFQTHCGSVSKREFYQLRAGLEKR